MNISLRTTLAIGALTLLTHTAQASSIRTFDPYTSDTPSINLAWSPVALSATGAMGAMVESIAPAESSWLESRAIYRAITSHLPLASVTQDAIDGRLLSAHFTGGFQVTAEDDKITNSGGALSIYNLHIDLPSQTVFATVDGANGVGLIDNMALWQFTGATGSFSAENGLRMTIPNLAFTQDGMNLLGQSLGLLPDGQSAWSKVASFGKITAVPEASTYSMALLGLMGLAAVARRKARP